jgi:ATP-dependent RNA/DNA helicase IGHMBP2
MTNIFEDLTFCLKLLKQEWEEDYQGFIKKSLHKTLQEKKVEGVCLYPLSIRRHRYLAGDRILLELEGVDPSMSHQFQSGKSVSLFSNQDNMGAGEARVSGVVNSLRKNAVILTLNSPFLPDWLHDGRLGLDLLFDQTSYKEMEAALKVMLKVEKGRPAVLRDTLLGYRKARFTTLPAISHPFINTSQLEALQKTAEADDVAIIHGPPGTGKTTTILAAISENLKQHHQVLVCAPSNAAVDLLVEKLLDQGISVLRLGHPARIEDRIFDQTLDAQIAAHDSYRDLKKVRKEAEEYRSMAKKYKRNFGEQERAQRKRMFEMSTRLKEEASLLEDYILQDVLQKNQVIATTLVGSSHTVLKDKTFPVVFIDEAGQGLEPATWIPVIKAGKVILAGDHCQLPPTVKSFEAGEKGLKITLFEKAIEGQPEAASILTLQYRMPQLIMGFSNDEFYQGKLKAAKEVEDRSLGDGKPVMLFVDTAGSGFSEHVEKDSNSKVNEEEAAFAVNLLDTLVKEVGEEKMLDQGWDLGLISPYSAQVKKMREIVAEGDFPALARMQDLLTVDTIDGFQGQERDVIFISLVRSNPEGEIGFLSDTRRMNVALTRAKRKLVVIGDSSTIGTHPFYQRFLNYVEEKGLYKSIYEFDLFE